ncbi:MAG: hypothetical protein ACJAYN_003379, partial [Bermanella sp.]
MPQKATFFSKQCLLVRVLLVCLAISVNTTLCVHASAQSIPTINVSQQYQDGDVKLDGPWGFYWGEWLPLNELDSH